MLETSFWKLLFEHLPSLGIGLGVAATYLKISKFLTTQERANLRTAKLIKLHAKKHPEDEGYLVDDSRAI